MFEVDEKPVEGRANGYKLKMLCVRLCAKVGNLCLVVYDRPSDKGSAGG